ncbi:DUF1345 domain-containing protein [Tabrizicola fusiformis]|uniref:DUF1345 domain-containing protein n=1 Tax=Tabrizicola sp. SY72 TaxID=2741673 RepID=UPI0015723AA0|nr:DUF1345 domain-containing protein [Tabrizicola sp. SY72]NTT85488.1 DUF1345 domain-containing protein [Tabrizicola sp. SY72]
MRSWQRHRRFLLALGFGAAIFAAMQAMAVTQALRALLAFDGFALTYLLLMAQHARTATPDDLRRHAETEDEGITLILLLALGSLLVSLAAIWLVLGEAAPLSRPFDMLLALAAVPLGWAMVHTLASFRYAHLHYAPDESCQLDFPGQEPPNLWDFLYFGFTIGMTAQTSDVVVATARMRRVVLLHAVAAFFYNTVILALAVNAALALAR